MTICCLPASGWPQSGLPSVGQTRKTVLHPLNLQPLAFAAMPQSDDAPALMTQLGRILLTCPSYPPPQEKVPFLCGRGLHLTVCANITHPHPLPLLIGKGTEKSAQVFRDKYVEVCSGSSCLQDRPLSSLENIMHPNFCSAVPTPAQQIPTWVNMTTWTLPPPGSLPCSPLPDIFMCISC